MKRTLLGGLVLAIALFVGQVGTSQAAPVTIDLNYVGFCDGASISYDVVTGLADGVQSGPSCFSTISGNMMGTVATIFGQGDAVTMGYDSTASYVGLITVHRADNTWTIYNNTGFGITVVNSGTWALGLPLASETSGLPSAAGK